MKTYGLLPSQTLESLTTDDNGDFLPPLDEGVTAVPLIKVPMPEVTSAQVANPVLAWFDDRVERQWVVTERTLTEAETITARRASMAAAFDALPLSVQASFYTARMTAEAAMDRGRFDIARALIEAVSVPAELEATKAVILSHFP